jgi:Cytidylyltransferase-like
MASPDQPLDRFFEAGRLLHVAADGQMTLPMDTPRGLLLLPGSFNPLHRGHWKLAQIAAQIVGQPAAFELSVVNVDKPTLSRDGVRRRLLPFNWQASVWLTRAPKFSDKAECFPGATFAVGADTALRIVSPRYYEDEARMLSALARLRELECRFLVACRVDDRGQCLGQADLPIPPAFGDLFTEIAPEHFRWDISSTQLRAMR